MPYFRQKEGSFILEMNRVELHVQMEYWRE